MTNNSLTILAPSPINFWTSSEPETLIKVHSVWCATARARSVFPVPGGPYSNTPWKNWMISTCILKKLHLHRTGLFIFKMFFKINFLICNLCWCLPFCFLSLYSWWSNDNTDFEYKMNTISLLESFEWLDRFTIIILQHYTSTSAQHLWAALNS